MEKGKKPVKNAKKISNNKNDKKAQINNQIIQLQGKFKQAKVATVRKLVDKLKHPEKNPKQNRAAKSERYQNVLNQIKHMSPKRLGLLALMYYKSGKNYLADSSSTVDQLVVGYFCEHKSVNDILDAIRKKLKLDESWNWRRSVRKLFKKKNKTLNAEKVKKKKNSFTETDGTDSTATTKGKHKKDQQKAEPNGKPEKAVKPKKKQKEPDAEPSESEESDSSESDDDVDVRPAEKNQVSEPPTTVDDFFITADGSNYLSTAIPNQKQEVDSDGETNQRLYRSKDFDRKPKEASFFHKSDKKPVKLAVNRSEGTKRKWLDDREEQTGQPMEKKVDPELHPSWQAKQKLKPTITEFKGKKITFD
ncbi:serum response factor-binding protein 1 [Sitodiplosis mosellana]|uniref:serum response factor-binding protein 1 n=1 Tax=Sitodiplosis mosellana TaxID=263140 RepID=UPI002443B9FB|nr:serum response factor-binding protein 1 [Sitodiplosis mosellana]